MDRRGFLQGVAAAASSLPLAERQARAETKRGKITLLVGTAPPDPACHFFYYAVANGYYREAGLEVEIKPVAAETTALRGLLAGEGDVAWVGAVSTLQAVAAGSKLRVLSAFASKLDYQIVAQTDIPDLKGLAQHSVAVSQVGAVSQIVPEIMIRGAGGDTATVQWLSVGGSTTRVQTLVGKRADAAALNSAFTARAERLGHVHVIGDALKDLPNFIYTWEVVSATTVGKRPEALQAFVTATARGTRWALRNPAKAAALSQKILPDNPPEELEAAAAGFAKKQFFSPTGELPRAAWDYTVAWLMQSSDIKAVPRYQEIVLPQFAAAAAKQLGPWKL